MLSIRAVAPEEPRAHTAGLLFLSGAALSGLGVLLPHSPQADIPGFIGLAVGAGLVGVVLLAIGDRVDRRVPFGAMLIASFLVGLSLVFNGERHGGPSAGNEVLFLWVALYAGYYFRGSALRVQLMAVAIADAAALLIIAPGDIGYTRWLITTGGAVIAGTVVHRLRKRNDELLGDLVEAGRTDQLTSLANRRGFDNAIGGALARSVRNGSPLALVLGDLDHFKRLNDTLGHLAGDEALELVGDVVAALIRRGDTAARLGGDEFAVILPDTDATAALALSERLRSRISAHRDGEGTVLSMSFGIAVAPIPCRTVLELMRAADIALYAAKRAGGNQALVSKLYTTPAMAGEEDPHATREANRGARI